MNLRRNRTAAKHGDYPLSVCDLGLKMPVNARSGSALAHHDAKGRPSAWGVARPEYAGGNTIPS